MCGVVVEVKPWEGSVMRKAVREGGGTRARYRLWRRNRSYEPERERLWWKWLVLVAILGLCAVMVVLAIEGAELLMIGCGAAAVLLGLMLIVFG